MPVDASHREAAAPPGATWRVPNAVRLALSALLLRVACYLGSELDRALRLPQVGTAILFTLRNPIAVTARSDWLSSYSVIDE
jgi:hypothetical protein